MYLDNGCKMLSENLIHLAFKERWLAVAVFYKITIFIIK